MFFNKNEKKNWRFCTWFLTVLCFAVCFAPSPPPASLLALWEGRAARAKKKKRRCCRWWIPLWTASFTAECVQWARARSWNLANETHPPEGLLTSHWLRGWWRMRRLVDRVLCKQLSERVANQAHCVHIQHGTQRTRQRGSTQVQDIRKYFSPAQDVKTSDLPFVFSPHLWHFACLSRCPPRSCEPSSAEGQDARRGDDEHFRSQVSFLWSAHGGRCLKAEKWQEKKESSGRRERVWLQPRGK